MGARGVVRSDKSGFSGCGHGFQPLRVRYHQGDMARIEVAPEAMAKFADPDFRRLVIQELKAAGFRYVSLDLEGFRSGSLNEALPADVLQIRSK